MATFPGGVKTFTSKNSGDVIAASHVNDLQDEVNAVEDGLRNGTAPLSSSNSTFANLSITGGSTLAKVEVSGGSTLATMNVTGGSTWAVRPVQPPPDMVLVYRESSYVAASSATSTIAWNQQAIVTNSSMHSTTTNPERVTPQSTGIWAITAQMVIAGPTAANPSARALQIFDSSGTLLGEHARKSSESIGVQASAYKRFDALGGYVTVTFLTDGTSTQSLSSGVGMTWLAMRKM